MALPPFPVPPLVLRFGMGLRRRVLDVSDMLLPAEGALWDFAAGMQRTKLAGVMVTTGIADALGSRSRDPAEVARELELDPEAMLRVLRTAAAARLVGFDGAGNVRLLRLGAPLRGDHPRSIAAWVGYIAAPANFASYSELEAQLRDGAEPSGHRRAHGNSVWEYFGEHPAEGIRFDKAMRELSAFDVAALARAYPWPRRGTVCDVAGGIGTLLAAILERRRGLRGILIDSPSVLAEGEGYLRERGVGARVECTPGDMFGELSAHADVYVLKWIMHDWNDEACRGILSRIRATAPPGARVVTIDQRNEPERPNPFTSIGDLHMLVECEGGRERTPAEMHGLMRDAGFAPGKVRHAGLHMLVEGIAR